MIAWSIPAMAWTWLASPRKPSEVTIELPRLGAGGVSPGSLNKHQYLVGIWTTGFPSASMLRSHPKGLLSDGGDVLLEIAGYPLGWTRILRSRVKVELTGGGTSLVRPVGRCGSPFCKKTGVRVSLSRSL
ncbi:hypothetical protein BHE74_00019231 [Ensete ventricosum]|nr:hypothetical protein GW17_00035766 [Ensete ventricosum]RWW72932.1 hypothetical protein BHE74_00019231 [Ensete ventricosum]RZS00493.1 hypothetical protein BHM03_00030199 [Ensete ventricosum]